MIALIISLDGAVHRDSVRRWEYKTADLKVDWARIAQIVLLFAVVRAGILTPEVVHRGLEERTQR